jgi:uncharacterized protein CbrC (UPF0167 family)
MLLPRFKYHPDPLSTGSIVASNEVCEVCQQARGFVYAVPVYCLHQPKAVCPWCIADGSAARALEAMFSDDDPLISGGIPEAVVEEVTRRTPGYASWQQEVWMTHCGDACAFLGDASKETVSSLAGTEREALLHREGLRQADWERVAAGYEPGGDPAVYHFRCLHCGTSVFALDSRDVWVDRPRHRPRRVIAGRSTTGPFQIAATYSPPHSYHSRARQPSTIGDAYVVARMLTRAVQEVEVAWHPEMEDPAETDAYTSGPINLRS